MRRSALFELVFAVAVALALALSVQAYAVKPYRIPSGSMEPTLHVGDRVLVNRFSHRVGATPKVGQIVVFHPPAGADASGRCGNPDEGGGTPTPCSTPTSTASSQTFIKRVVGVAGDRIAIRNGHVVRNGRRQFEPFAAPCVPDGDPCDFPKAITVRRDSVFLMGDNRGNSQDSRFWGPVPISWVIGRAFAVYWPPGRAGPP